MMTMREDLLLSAGELDPPRTFAADAFGDAADSIATELGQKLCQRSDLDSIIGHGDPALMETHCFIFCRLLTDHFVDFQPKAFVDTLIFSVRAYQTRDFQLAYWPALVGACQGITRELLPEGVFAELTPFFEWTLEHIDDFESAGQHVPG